MDFLTNILIKYSHFSSVIIEQDEADKYKEDFETLLVLNVLEKVSDPKYIWCKTCQSEGVEVHFVSKDRAFTLCTQDEYAGRDYFNPSELKQWRFNAPCLLQLFQKVIGIQSPTVNESIQELLWDFGIQKVNGANYHLFFCRNINAIENSKLSIVTSLPHSVVFYTGNPQIALPENVLLVPIVDLIQKVSNKGFFLASEVFEDFFPKNVYAAQKGGIELDKSMILQNNTIMYKPLRAGQFQNKTEKLPPLASRVIEHLYLIRKYSSPSKKLDEFEASLGSKKRVISREIKRINDLCGEHNMKPILHKYSDESWGINPELSSCK